MKELTIQEKAERYNKAYKVAENIHKCSSNPAEIKRMEQIFPELKESEGEKIRKVLIGWINLEPSTSFNDTFDGFSKEQILAWLEKQGNTNIFDVPKISIKNAVEVTSRMQYIDDDIKPIAEFIMDYANWDLNKDKWNQPTLTVPLFRVLDALIQKGKPYCECNQNIEKQGEHNHCMIQWKGDNLKEVIDFTGKDKNFEKWFKSFEEYEKYVQEHDGIFKLFNADGSHYEVPVGAWIVKTPDGYNVASKAIFRQKSVDTPKFKVGDWVVFNNKHQSIYQVEKIEDGYYILRHTHGETFSVCVLHDESLRLWTIQDAKNGDVLAVTMYPEGTWIGIFKEQNGCTFSSYCFVNTKGIFKRGAYNHGNGTAVHPATKEQREQLEKAMADAGYAFDFDKKELKKIEDEEYDGDDYGIDSLWHAKNILERTLGKVDGYQTDDGILDHKCAITAVDKLYKNSIAWSERDKHWIQKVIDFMNHPDLIKATPTLAKDTINWLKSLKDRIDTLDSNALIL